MAANEVRCTFFDTKTRHIIETKIKFDTTLNANMLSIRNACQDHARDIWSPAWVQPAGVEGSDKWLGYRMEGRNSHFVKHFPSKEAAEMWLLHHCV